MTNSNDLPGAPVPGVSPDATLPEDLDENVVVPAAPTLEEIDDKMLGRVSRMQDAYAAGDLDDKLIARAARAIGISEAEARRRLSTRLDLSGRTGTGSRTDRRKKSKQAKASRRKNRG
jgi:hypothetical protein